LFPAVAETFVTTERRPILTLVEDTSPGFHDLLMAARDRARWILQERGETQNCCEHIHPRRTSLGTYPLPPDGPAGS
jgi:hypothetical protein